MAIGDKVSQMANSMQEGVKNSSLNLATLTLRLITGFFVGLVLALIGEELMNYGTVSFVFVIMVCIGLIYKTTTSWSMSKILVFDLILILIAMLLRMYILVAP